MFGRKVRDDSIKFGRIQTANPIMVGTQQMKTRRRENEDSGHQSK